MLRKNPCCGNCDFYDPDHVVETTKRVSGQSCYPYTSSISPFCSGTLTVSEKGACKLYPDKTPHKTPDDWCGQHSNYRK